MTDAENACAASEINDPISAELDRLKRELSMLQTAGIIEVAVRNPSVADYMRHWEGRAERAEAERDEAVRARDEWMRSAIEQQARRERLAAEQAAPVAVEPKRGAYTQEMTDEFTDAQFATPPAVQVAELERLTKERDDANDRLMVSQETVASYSGVISELSAKVAAAEARATAAEAQAAKIEVETIERCAKVAEGHRGANYTVGNFVKWRLPSAHDIARSIRSLASPAQEPQE